MAQKKISLKDRATIKKRLAQGLSYADCIKGTNVKSARSVTDIARTKVQDIAQMKQDYIALIESFGAGDAERAELWAKMTKANIIHQGKEKKKAPDWRNRGEALKYIEGLKFPQQQKQQGGTQVNVFTQASKRAKEFVEGEEV